MGNYGIAVRRAVFPPEKLRTRGRLDLLPPARMGKSLAKRSGMTIEIKVGRRHDLRFHDFHVI
ncbi:MAG: hypothetical protein R3D52_13950 [Xanthobacteraceae bacterium]